VTNRSSGKMGYRVAEVAWERGADVLLISGPVALEPPVGVRLRRVETTKELEDAVRAELPQTDVLVMAAAPADFRPSDPSDSKRARMDGALAIPMEPTDDILSATRGLRRPGSVTVGFALETGDAMAKGRAKLERKDLDLIVINDALEPGAGFEVDTNRVALLGREGAARILPLQSKREVAEAILDTVERSLGG
jgi:phosphopantothenoylcysteine decarboxylase/phosphopantothenate--cysteine ligase